MSWWGGREHFITACVERWSDVCIYFEGCIGASVGVGDEGSGVGESEEGVDDEGESSRERLGIAFCECGSEDVTLVMSCPTCYLFQCHMVSSTGLQKVSICIQRIRERYYTSSRRLCFAAAYSDIKHGFKD